MALPPPGLCEAILVSLLLLQCAGGDSKVCKAPKRMDHTQPIEEPSFPVDTKFRYTCIEGYKRKAGTSNLAVCKLHNNEADWVYTNTFCIRDPSLPHLTTSTSNFVSMGTSQESTISTSTTTTTTIGIGPSTEMERLTTTVNAAQETFETVKANTQSPRAEPSPRNTIATIKDSRVTQEPGSIVTGETMTSTTTIGQGHFSGTLQESRTVIGCVSAAIIVFGILFSIFIYGKCRNRHSTPPMDGQTSQELQEHFNMNQDNSPSYDVQEIADESTNIL